MGRIWNHLVKNMIHIAPGVGIDERDIEEHFVRSSGPGGQNVNKVSTAVQLRYRVDAGGEWPEGVRARLARLAGRRLNRDGVLVINARRHRTREANRADALERLVTLVRQASHTPKARKPTRPSRAAKRRRVESKRRQGSLKVSRRTDRSPPE